MIKDQKMQNTLPRPKVAYIGLSLELYLSTSRGVARWKEAFAEWGNSLAAFADIRCQKLVFTPQEVQELEELLRKEELDAVVLSAVSYTPSLLIVPLLKKLGLPIVIWSTQDDGIIKEDYAPMDLTLNHTVQGIHDITNVLFQSQIKYSIVTGHWQDEKTLKRLEMTLKTVRAARAARKIRVLALGGAFTGMGDFDYDPENLKQVWGPEAVPLSAEEFLATVETVSPDEAEALRIKDQAFFEIMPDFSPDIHREAIRRKLAIRKLLEANAANAFTMNFLNLQSPSFGQLPFYAVNTLMAEGIGYAGEGDVLRAAAMRQLVELTGSANFSEIYTVDFKRDLFFMSHMQECSIGIARRDRKIRLKNMPFWTTGIPYPGMFFTAEPGEYTLVCITPAPGGKFKMIAFSGTVPDLPVLETYNRAYWLFKPRRPVGEILDDYSLAGGAHHLSAVPGSKLPELALLAEQLGFEFADIDRPLRA